MPSTGGCSPSPASLGVTREQVPVGSVLRKGNAILKATALGGTLPYADLGGLPGKGHRRKEGPPQCYEPPLAESTPRGVGETFMRVLSAWREGRHVVVVQGDGFNLG